MMVFRSCHQTQSFEAMYTTYIQVIALFVVVTVHTRLKIIAHNRDLHVLDRRGS